MKALFFALAFLFAAQAFASNQIILIRSTNLQDYSWEEKETRTCGGQWKTSVVVDGKKYYISGCAGSALDYTMRAATEEVFRSPYTEECVKSEYCDVYGRCQRYKGVRKVDQVIKAIVSPKGEITHWVRQGTIGKCE